MNNPRYGKINSSIPCLDDNLMRTNSNNKSIDIEVDSFNWEDDEFKKSQAKINLAQYDDKDDQYEDDFENEVKSNESTPKKSKPSGKKNVIDQKIKEKFTNEEEQFMNDWEFKDEEEKDTTIQKQVKEINELIEMATNFCLK